MKSNFVNILKCIKCNGNLDLKIQDKKNDEVWQGELICKKCNFSYPIKEGIPVMFEDPSKAHFEPTAELEEISHVLPPTKKIAELIKKRSNCFTLEAGCGPGGYLDYYQSDIVALDIIPYFLKLTRENYKGNHNLHLVAANVKKLPFKDNVFGFSVCSSVLEHLEEEDLANVIGDLERVTDGLVQVDTPNYSKFMRGLIELLIKIGFFKLDQKSDQTIDELYHHCFVTTSYLKSKGYAVKGCLGQISRGRLKCDWLADIYDLIMYHIPYLAGTIIGTKKVKK
jgi:uncharacterized protein YbaR (Trm112 family)/ubiquinone/menaquinone biosynthesis C-methylase UbiE